MTSATLHNHCSPFLTHRGRNKEHPPFPVPGAFPRNKEQQCSPFLTPYVRNKEQSPTTRTGARHG